MLPAWRPLTSEKSMAYGVLALGWLLGPGDTKLSPWEGAPGGMRCPTHPVADQWWELELGQKQERLLSCGAGACGTGGANRAQPQPHRLPEPFSSQILAGTALPWLHACFSHCTANQRLPSCPHERWLPVPRTCLQPTPGVASSSWNPLSDTHRKRALCAHGSEGKGLFHQPGV